MSDLVDILSKFNAISVPLIEGKSHIDHPEDMVFLYDDGGRKGLIALLNTVSNPNNITVKFDGYPAIIFGRGLNGKFIMVDKHMFDRKDGTGKEIYSVEDFARYDQNRSVDRGELYNLLAFVWNDLEKATQNKSGYYWGDVLFRSKLTPINGEYTFKANPSGLTYKVKADSDIGKLIQGKLAGIVIHQKLSETAISTDFAESLNGGIDGLSSTKVAILPSALPVSPNLSIDKKLLSSLTNSIKEYNNAVSALFNDIPISSTTFRQLFTVYVNRKIMSGDLQNLVNNFYDYISNRSMSSGQRARVMRHLEQNSEGIIGAFSIWIDLFNLKNSILNQLESANKKSPIVGYLNDGTQTQEGYVSQGIKLVDRLGFSRQNLIGN